MATPYLAVICSVAVTVDVPWCTACDAAGSASTSGRSDVGSGCAVVAASAAVVEIIVIVHLHVSPVTTAADIDIMTAALEVC
jgi:hypothetical protein